MHGKLRNESKQLTAKNGYFSILSSTDKARIGIFAPPDDNGIKESGVWCNDQHTDFFYAGYISNYSDIQKTVASH